MRLTDCVDWKQASITAMRRYDDTKKAIYVLSDQLNTKKDVPARPGTAFADQSMLETNLMDCSRFVEQFDRAWGQLTGEEQRLLYVKYRSKKTATQAIVTLMDEFGYEKTRLYDYINMALTRLANLLFGAA